MKTLFEEVNDKELKYWEKNENFWRLMFSCCIGFVSFVTPFLLNDKISTDCQSWMKVSVLSGAACAGFTIPILRRSIRQYRDLWLAGKAIAEGRAPLRNVELPNRTVWETISLCGVVCSACLAGGSLAIALFLGK